MKTENDYLDMERQRDTARNSAARLQKRVDRMIAEREEVGSQIAQLALAIQVHAVALREGE